MKYTLEEEIIKKREQNLMISYLPYIDDNDTTNVDNANGGNNGKNIDKNGDNDGDNGINNDNNNENNMMIYTEDPDLKESVVTGLKKSKFTIHI